MTKVEIDFSKKPLKFDFIQDDWTTGCISIRDESNTLEIELSDDNLESLKRFLSRTLIKELYE